MDWLSNITYIGLLYLCFITIKVESQTCLVDIPDAKRRDCYPWPGASQSGCESRGCVWCASDQSGYPYCFYDDTVCPSEIPEASRVDCLAGDPSGNKEKCNAAGCIWCESATAGIPWCFSDASVSQGGSTCPSSIAESERIDCHPESGATETECLARGCYWCTSSTPNVPWCFAPKQNGYRIVGTPTATAKGWTLDLRRINTPSWYGSDVTNIRMDVEYHTLERLRVKIYDPSKSRFEVPLQIPSPPSKPADTLYDVQFSTGSTFSFKVIRKSNGAVLFDTAIGGLIISDQFLQIATYLNSPNVYGFGEQEHLSYRQDMNWQRLTMYSRDQAVTTSNLYGVQPFYMNLEQSSSAHGVLFLNANAQEVTLQPRPAITYRTIGGILDLYFFLGPTPESVIQQYGQAVGFPVMVPYWSLGFQLCRWGYTDLNHMKAAVDRMRQYDIPHDVQYGDIDYMDSALDFTINPVEFADLPSYVNELKAEGTRFVIILDPGISYVQTPGTYPPFDNGQAANIWVKTKDGITTAQGEVWPGPVYYPDFHKQETEDWWVDECIAFKSRLDFAGLWIDMNEVSNFIDGSPSGCPLDAINTPPYIPRVVDSAGNANSRLWQKTVCLDSKQSAGDQYNVHSLYGWSMARASLRAARESTGERSVVFSRSTFPGAGQWGQHWLGDNWSRWSNLRASVIGLFEFNMFGFPYVGADICGFNEVTTEEMCTRWQQLGAFYTFARNHNAAGNPDQDPGVWPQVAQVTRETLHIRYTLLPYLYTLFYRAHTQGGTVIRPLLFEFPQDGNTYSINDQFLWGPAFMISPVLDQGSTSVNIYFPNTRWYNYYDGAEENTKGASRVVSAPITYIPLHVRGGYILPTQQPSNSTLFSRRLPMGLIVALSSSGSATGELFWDDGDTIDTISSGNYVFLRFSCSASTITSSIINNGYSTSLVFGDVRVLGITATVNGVAVNGLTYSSWTQDASSKQLTISGLNLPIGTAFTISWS